MKAIFSLLFLFLYVSIYYLRFDFNHVNEIFNGLSHSHVYAASYFDVEEQLMVIRQTTMNQIIDQYFRDNIRPGINYIYLTTYYFENDVVDQYSPANKFSVRLNANIAFYVTYDKTFIYEIRTANG